MLKNLWNDEAGSIISSELVLVATITVIGLVTGLTSLRDGVIEELADVGKAIGTVDQSYTVGGSQSHSSGTPSFGFIDSQDYCDGATSSGTNSRCLVISPAAAAASTETGGQ